MSRYGVAKLPALAQTSHSENGGGAGSASARRVLLTDAQERSVLAACRSLSAAGYVVDAAASERPAPTHWSRCCARRLTVSDPKDDAPGFVEELHQLVAVGGHDVLLPGSDAALVAISRHRDRLQRTVRIGLPEPEAVERSLSKISLAEAAADLGWPTPETFVCDDPADAIDVARRLGYPVVLKPHRSVFEHGGRVYHHGSVVAEDQASLIRYLPELGSPFLLQRPVDGPLISFGGVVAGGRLLSYAVSRYRRTWPPAAGSVSYSDTIAASPKLAQFALELVEGIGWQGVFELEFLERSNGDLLPIDFNPRVYGSLALAGEAGAPLAVAWCDWLVGSEPSTGVAPEGYRYRWDDADLRHLVWLLRNRRFRPALSLIRPRRRTVHAHLWATDPLPMAARAALMVKHGIQGTSSAKAPSAREPALPSAGATAAPDIVGRAAERPVVIIGAGPYGLATVAFLREAGAQVRIFGRSMEFWRTRMPEGMLLRSRWRSSHIANPTGSLSLDVYERASGISLPDHIPVERFIDYGRWYQEQTAPDLDERLVERVVRSDGGFGITLQDGEEVEAGRIVVAAGLEPFPHRAEPLAELPPELVSHSSDHVDFGRFRDQRVLVIGGGQSALESAALLHEHGARVELLARAAELKWLEPEGLTTLSARVNDSIQPPTDVGGRATGWAAAAPDLFRVLPTRFREAVARRCTIPKGAAWLIPRLADVPLTVGCRAVAGEPTDEGIRVRLDDDSVRVVDHVVLGTGFRIDVSAYEFLDSDLVSELATSDGYPILGPGLESNVSGLHFMGAPSALSFGPIMRFVVGTWYAAPAVAERATGRPRRRLSYRPRREGAGAERPPSD